MTSNAKKAIKIGYLCFLSYFAVYIAKNVLGAVTPSMMKEGFTDSAIGAASSVYFYTYAVGQLINGAIGDRIKAKYMMSFGLLFAGISNFVFSLLNDSYAVLGEIPITAYIAYGCTGFFLAMIYGPMTKVVSENTEAPYTTRCTLGYTVASYLGSPAAGLFAALFAWQTAFSVSSAALVAMSAVVFLAFSVFEKKGLISYGKYTAPKKRADKKGVIKLLTERGIVKFSFISILTGIIRTSSVFWLATYFSERLGFSEEKAGLSFSVATLGIASTSFIVIFIYERIGHDIDKTLLLTFSSAAVFFALTYFVTFDPYVNVVLIVLSIMSSNGAATMLWSRYCPSLRDTGVVSGATGFLDFLSYISAGTMNLLTPHLVHAIGWGGVVIVWFSFMAAGVLLSLPRKKIKGHIG